MGLSAQAYKYLTWDDKQLSILTHYFFLVTKSRDPLSMGLLSRSTIISRQARLGKVMLNRAHTDLLILRHRKAPIFLCGNGVSVSKRLEFG